MASWAVAVPPTAHRAWMVSERGMRCPAKYSSKTKRLRTTSTRTILASRSIRRMVSISVEPPAFGGCARESAKRWATGTALPLRTSRAICLRTWLRPPAP